MIVSHTPGTDYTPDMVAALASASAPVRAAAHQAKALGLGFTLQADTVSCTAVLTVPDPTAPDYARGRRYLGITMTRKTPTARPAHAVVQVVGHSKERLQVAQIPSRIRRYAGQQ